jgi:hypothetical protein
VGGSGSEGERSRGGEEHRRTGGEEERRRGGQDLPEERDETRLELELVIEWARQGSLTLTSVLVRAWSIASAYCWAQHASQPQSITDSTVPYGTVLRSQRKMQEARRSVFCFEQARLETPLETGGLTLDA